MSVVKVGDSAVGICPCHSPSPLLANVTYTSGIGTVLVNGSPVMVLGGTGVSSCGHNAIIITGSASVTVGGSGVHLIGGTCQVCAGTATTTTASSDVLGS